MLTSETKTRLPILFRDAAVLAGTACLVSGCWLAWHPLGLIAGGLATLAFGMLWEADQQRRREIDERNRRNGV